MFSNVIFLHLLEVESSVVEFCALLKFVNSITDQKGPTGLKPRVKSKDLVLEKRLMF